MKIRRFVISAVVGGSLLLGAPAAAFASTHAVKAGGTCTKAQSGKTTKSGTTTLVCKKSGTKYKWADK